MPNPRFLLCVLAGTALLTGCNTADLKTARLAAASGDEATARAMYTELAAYGIPEAQAELASLTMSKSASPAERKTALELLKEAAKTNPAVSMKLGDMYEKGTGVPVNLTLAYKYFLQAFDMGSTKAAYRIGNVLMDTPGNDRVSYEWLEKARLNGEHKAALRIGRFYAKRNQQAKAIGYFLYAQDHGIDIADSITKLKAPAETVKAGELLARQLSAGVSPQFN